jgi:selenocysteine lyase/cysteine desulfurase|tara:strand:- start:649 stop:1878 length:1230 start_codon:yes stop_codon:yes gene_type:complete
MLKVYPKAKQINEVRNCFPSLAYTELAYLDNAASSQTVDSAIKAVSDYHYNYRANVHRGDFETSGIASEIYDQAREEVAKLINCDTSEIAFTAGTTQGLNIIADYLAGDRTVVITELEHHSNILPWMQHGYTTTNGKLVVVPASDHGDISIEDFTKAIEENPGSIVSFLTQSNLTGMNTPWQQMVRIAKEHDCEVIIDACQSIAHKQIDLQANNIDWMVFSGHKMYASTGSGVLFHRGGFSEVIGNDLGGGTAEFVSFEEYNLHGNYERIEAGTPNIAGVHSVGAAAKWISEIGYKTIQENEAEFFNMVRDKGLFDIPGLKLIGHMGPRSVYSFVTEGCNPSDIAGYLSFDKVCVRTGHMCAQPASRRYNQEGTGVFRVSSAPYNNELDCVKLVEGLWKAMDKIASKTK